MSKCFKERVDLANKVLHNEATDRIPYYPSIQTWGIGYGGGRCADVIRNPQKEMEYYGKAVRDTHMDGVMIFGLNRPDIWLGAPMGFVNSSFGDDGVTIMVPDISNIMDDEVEMFAKDPLSFWKNTAIPRRYPNINKPYPENVNAAVGAIKGLMGFGNRMKYIEKTLKKDYDVPLLANGIAEMPFDAYVMMRGFSKGMTDLRRHSGAILEAMENMYEISKPTGKMKPFAFQISPMTSGTYLNGKMFDKFYWPTTKKMIDDYLKLGANMILFLEGKWGKEKIEHFLDFPKGRIILMLDEDDPVEVKKIVGDRLGLYVGFPAAKLKTETPDKIKEQAVRIFETMGNRGIALTIDKCLLSPVDAKAENVIALGEICQEYRF